MGDHTRRRTPPSTQTLLLGRLLGPVGVSGGIDPHAGRRSRLYMLVAEALRSTTNAFCVGPVRRQSLPTTLTRVRAVGRGRALFPPQASDDDATVDAPAALDRDAFRHVLSFWQPVPQPPDDDSGENST